jgi:hypothetical protein
MYQILATKMAVTTTAEVTQAIAMQGANAIVVDITVFSGTVESDDLFLQGSNDLENWTNLGAVLSDADLAAGAYYLPRASSAFTGPRKEVATQYVRLRLKSASGTAFVACGINTSMQ